MGIFQSVDLIVYSQLILGYMMINLYGRNAKKEWSTKLFFLILYLLSAVNILEGVTWAISGIRFPFDRGISIALNTLLLAMNSLPAVAWVSYADYKLFGDIEKLKKRVIWYLVPFFVTVVLLVVNIPTGIVFTVDDKNIYGRNIGVTVIALMTYIMIAVLFFRTRKYKRQIDGKIIQSIFLFMLIPITAGIIQLFAYGVLIIWPSFILATLIAFIQVEKDTILRDSLTGLPTRDLLEQRLQYLIGKNIGFSIIMADMNDFKKINDRYGHDEGDQALVTAASILKHSVKSYDMVCRYGGDEFVILVESEHEKAAEKVMERIRQASEVYSRKMLKPYRLSMSFGNCFRNSQNKRSAKEVLCEADRLMYLDKEKYKRENGSLR